MRRIFFILIFIMLSFYFVNIKKSDALTLDIDPGIAGTSYFYNDFNLVGALDGTPLNGQTESIDIIFSSNKFAVAGKFGIDLWINESDGMGIWPTSYSSITGSLLDKNGSQITESNNFVHTGTMPTQIWPGWGYYLPDGTEYLPAATGYSNYFPGTPTNIQPDGSYYLEPIIFSGVHFDITFPVTPSISAMGLRMVLYNFSDYDSYNDTWRNPIYISPDITPDFYVPVPEPATIILFGTGLAGLVGARLRMKKSA